MKRPALALATGCAVLAFAVQVSLPPALAGHMAKLKDAQTLKAKVTISQVGGAPSTIEVTYGKPGNIKIDSPARLVVSDGKTLSILDKSKNTFTQAPYEKAAVLAEATDPGLWGWAGFLETDPAKLIKSAKAGSTRKLRGIEVSEVETTLADGKTTATLYIDPKTGIARGYQYNQDGRQYIVWAESIEATATAADAALFAFSPPAGATKVEPTAGPDWATVGRIFTLKCMPCHSTNVKAGTLDLTNYASAAGSRFVLKGDSKNSILVLSLTSAGGKRMPQGRPPLPASEIKTISDWIDGGLKQ